MAATGGRLRLDAVDVVTDCVSVQTVSRKGFSILDMASCYFGNFDRFPHTARPSVWTISTSASLHSRLLYTYTHTHTHLSPRASSIRNDRFSTHAPAVERKRRWFIFMNIYAKVTSVAIACNASRLWCAIVFAQLHVTLVFDKRTCFSCLIIPGTSI